MNDSTSSTSVSPPVEPQRVSVLLGDRLCTTCGYNLTGQTVMREPHYNLLIVRCPECATVAGVQEYPLLGRWANRWAMVLAGILLLLAFGFWIGTGAMMFGFSLGTAESAAFRFGYFIQTKFEADQAAGQVVAPAAGGNPAVNMPLNWSAWASQQDLDALVSEAGGWLRAIDPTVFVILVPYGLVTFVFGCVWAVALLGTSWRKRLVLVPIMLVPAILFSVIAYLDWRDSTMWGWNWSRRTVGPPVLVGSLIFGTIALSLGMIYGRSVARWFVTLMLPPRLRSALAMLWITDGLPPPKTGR